MSEQTRDRLVDALGSGAVANVPAPVRDATNAAFVDALSTGLIIAAAATLIAALLAWLLVDPARPQHEPRPTAEPEAAMV